jgi:membrane protein
LTEQVRAFLENRKAVGIIGFLAMLFFSPTAFSVPESAMSVIFSERVRSRNCNFLLSAFIPYAYIFVMGLGIVLVSFIVGAIETLESRHVTFLGWSLNLGGAYRGCTLHPENMPVARVKFRHVLIGG